jgi:hypothetical protein
MRKGTTSQLGEKLIPALVSNALYQGMTSVMPIKPTELTSGFSPCGIFFEAFIRIGPFSPSCSVVPIMPKKVGL